ncbi:MAG TPA: hypothetical protein VFI31_04940 [Pirellulales bacterium]|nr:hypothetical protein [Pirellulales bacterium]
MPDRLQFSIRSMLSLTAVFAVLLAVFLWKPAAASILARFIVGYLLMSLAISAIHITAGVARAFWIGVTAPLVMSAIWLSLIGHQTYWGWNGLYKEYTECTAAEMDPVWRTFANELNVVPISCCLALINGLVCALVYRLIGPQRGPESIPSSHIPSLWVFLARHRARGDFVFPGWDDVRSLARCSRMI